MDLAIALWRSLTKLLIIHFIKAMSSIIRKHGLNTIEDKYWDDFQRSARNRRVIAIATTAIFAVISWSIQSLLPLLIGELILWLALKLWIRATNKK